MTGSAPSLAALEGAVIDGRYVLRRLIGEGGFGGVFASNQHLLGVRLRRVAVKVSRLTGIEEGTARELFADAFALAEAMDQMVDAEARRHLVHVYDVGIAVELMSRAYVVMEYVDGGTLGAQLRRARRSRIPTATMLRWMREACCALAGLHRLNPPVLHRDVKPDNILIGHDTVRLVDFGLAARLRLGGLAPDVAGTTDYMAPEAALGTSLPASDVYSLGVVLYEGLAGQRPFSHVVPPAGHPKALREAWIREQQAQVQITPPSRHSDTSPELDELVLSCLSSDPSRRPADAGELLEALDGLDRSGAVEPVATPLERGHWLLREGDAEGAQRAFEDGLTLADAQPVTRFWLLRELGAWHAAHDDPAAAVGRLVEAWSLTSTAAILRTRAERGALLRLISDCYTRIGNSYQAGRYARMATAEEGGVHG